MTEFTFDMMLNYKLAGIIREYSNGKPTLIVRNKWRIKKYLFYFHFLSNIFTDARERKVYKIENDIHFRIKIKI